jgi:histidinol-phosphate aminotransferase
VVAIQFAAAVKRIPVYPAGSGYAQTGPLVLLESNESPYPPLPEVVAAATAAVEGANRYPDPNSVALREALSARYGVPTDQITIGNGSCDILLAAGVALLEPGSELVYAWPSFSVYPQLEAISGAKAVTVALDANERHDLSALAAAVGPKTRLVIVCNPNNPTSTAVRFDQIEPFVAALPEHVCVLIDEAYCEFNSLDAPDATIQLLSRYPQLVLLRTFSKVYGLCGLRVGFALCGSPELPQALKLIRQPFFANVAAQAAAVEALRHPEEVARRVDAAHAARAELTASLRDLSLYPAESETNFVWFDLGRGDLDIVAGLAERGIMVRAGSALGRAGALRVTCGTPRENARFVDALRELIQ